eukprot:2753647-Pyramimonas_sp.AAC.1
MLSVVTLIVAKLLIRTRIVTVSVERIANQYSQYWQWYPDEKNKEGEQTGQRPVGYFSESLRMSHDSYV